MTKSILVLFISIVFMQAIHSQEDFFTAYKAKWENSARYTIQCAELMPESQYDFAPTLEQMSFKEQLLHILRNMQWLSTDYLDIDPFEENLRNADPGKTELIALLKKGYDHIGNRLSSISAHRLREQVDFFAGQKSIVQIMMLMDDHITHHRGQLVVYLRLKNITPPDYVGW